MHVDFRSYKPCYAHSLAPSDVLTSISSPTSWVLTANTKEKLVFHQKQQTKAEDRLVHEERTLIVVPCGARKIWHTNPHAGERPAREAYTSQLFKAYRDYAQAFGTEWRILSAKYGIMHPDQLIENYDRRFDASYLDPRNWWRLEGMVLQARALPSCDRLVLLGGNLYRCIMRRVFWGIYLPSEIDEPFAGCDLLTTIRKLRSAIETRGNR